MSYGIIAASVVSAGAGMYSANQAKKAAQAGANASQVDLSALDAIVRDMAKRNALDSAQLERELTPEVPQLRTAANQAVLSELGTTATDDYTRSMLSQLAESKTPSAQTPLLQAAIAKAKANLQLGGKIDSETQNAVTRAALTRAGTVGSGGLGLGRDIVARDLGLTSLDLENQRLAQAQALGGLELNAAGMDQERMFNDKTSLLNALGMLNTAQNARLQKNLAAAQYGQSIQQPIVGLDPASAANVVTGNASNSSAAYANKANIYGQQGQGYMNLAGQLGGYGLLAYNNRNTNYRDPSTNKDA
jgi:hypothetical protein